jgi:hypothetical protein
VSQVIAAPSLRDRLAVRAAVLVPFGALLSWAMIGAGFLNYDTAYALLWGGDLAHGRVPDSSIPLAPTAHPLATALGVLLTPLGDAGQTVWVVIAFGALGALGWLAYELGAHWFGPAAGAVAGLVIVTRIPVLSFGVRAYVDIPYVALALGALLVEARRPRAGALPLILLALAGLLRPEAWLLSFAYLGWLYWSGDRDLVRLAPLAALALSGPLLWALYDLALTGDPLHSLTGTRAGAEVLERTTGLAAVPGTVPRRLGEILREPGLLGATAGGLLVLAFMRRSARLPIAAGFASMAAFCVLAAAGLPILGRYLLLPAALLAVFCGAGAFGWLRLPADHPWRRRWAAIGAVVLLAFAVFAPGQVNRIRGLRDAMGIQSEILADLHAITATPAFTGGCRPVAVPNHRPVPHIALWAGIAPRQIISAQVQRPTHGLYVDPASARVERNFTLDPHDPHPLTAAVPAGFTRVAANRSWVLYARCQASANATG